MMRISVHWSLSSETSFVELGNNVALPTPFTARFEDDDQHPIELGIDVENGTPVCTSIHIKRNPKLGPLTGSEVSKLPVVRWVEVACLHASMRADREPGGALAMSPLDSIEDAQAAVNQIKGRTRRRRITNELLQDVANTYLASGGDIEAVARAHHVSVSQAFRYRKAAIERGLLKIEEDDDGQR